MSLTIMDQLELQRELAARFGVSISAIQFLLSGQHWSHVTEDVA